MKQKLLDLLEKHVDKLVLVIIAIASLAFLWFFVISNPYGAEVNRTKLSPGKIDAKISENAVRLEQIINGDPTEKVPAYAATGASDFMKKLASTVKVKDDVVIPMAVAAADKGDDKRSYRKPAIPPVTDAEAEVIRTSVWMPTETVDLTTPYEMVKAEVEDIDFVTVQGSFDTSELYRNFKNSFYTNADPAYRDEELAIPVFAAVGLERQVMEPGGQWSGWQAVSRPVIDSRKEMFKVPQKAGDIELGGVDVLVMNFDSFPVMKALLQPNPYEIAVSNEMWMTPEFHEQYAEIRESMPKTRMGQPGDPGNPYGNPYGGNPYGPTGAMDPTAAYGEQPGAARDPRLALKARREALKKMRTSRDRKIPDKDITIEDIREDFEFIKLTEDLPLENLKDPVVFWAFDDDVKPLHSYRYRIRIGVFNPTAGKDWFSGVDAAYKDDVILWSEYSDVTEDINVEPMIQFFPVETTKRDKAVIVDVARFHRGKWWSNTFEVRKGGAIGDLVDIEPSAAAVDNRKRTKVAEKVEQIDFRTGATFVRIEEIKSTSRGQRPRQEMVYTVNGGPEQSMGISRRNWTKEQVASYEKVQDDKGVFVEVFKARGQMGGGMYPGGGPGGMNEYEMLMGEGEMMGPGAY